MIWEASFYNDLLPGEEFYFEPNTIKYKKIDNEYYYSESIKARNGSRIIYDKLFPNGLVYRCLTV